jgi:hypothetical protein
VDFTLPLLEDNTGLIRRKDAQLINHHSSGHVAKARIASSTNPDCLNPIDQSLPVKWAVNKQSAGLHERLNEWIIRRKGTLEFNMIVNKYTHLTKTQKEALANQYLKAKRGSICPYDELLKSYAHLADWDWLGSCPHLSGVKIQPPS